MGASIDFVKYDIFKDNRGTPEFLYRDVEGGATYNYASPFQLIYGTGNPNFDANNNQVGVYIQDDWSPASRLTINLGIRWDFETNMLNTDYVTPQNVVDTLTRYNDPLEHPLEQLGVSRAVAAGRFSVVADRPFAKEDGQKGADPVDGDSFRCRGRQSRGVLIHLLVDLGMLCDIPEHRQPGRYRQRISRKRSRLVNGTERSDLRHDVGAAAICANRQSAADHFSHRGQVRLYAEQLLRSAARQPESGHHFVKNQQRSIFGRDLA